MRDYFNKCAKKVFLICIERGCIIRDTKRLVLTDLNLLHEWQKGFFPCHNCPIISHCHPSHFFIFDHLARWIETLHYYQLEIQYRPGKIHNNADSLSRKTCRNGCFCKKEKDSSLSIMSITSSNYDWTTPQKAQHSLSWIINAMKSTLIQIGVLSRI